MTSTGTSRATGHANAPAGAGGTPRAGGSDRATVLAFEERATSFVEVVEFRRMFGLPDYFLRVATESLQHYESFVTDMLEDVPGIARVDSHLTMKHIK
ncbi:Lrp/AsnC ligand binding domain-containing protein [Streptomyces sp. NBC_01497]|uniref:Lrp/AsnC ligand binding domain-containing protein n=1 Tax=Streptomyces sp. NBC_01497 TaxID=2903885 RepID=UPI002E32CAE0|nr:Lrp/AsnC ligand binding domain-containing protein [Streptomyces sp. NBC_01497]